MVNMEEFLNSLSPVLSALFGAGGVFALFSAYLAYKGSKPLNDAEARAKDNKAKAEGFLAVIDNWQRIAETGEKRLEKFMAEMDKKVTELQERLEMQEREHREVVAQKDAQILDIQRKNRNLEIRVEDLERENIRLKESIEEKKTQV